jgi:hypothetical protein
MSTPQLQQVHDHRRPSTIRIWAMRLSILLIGAALVASGYAGYHDRTAPVGHLAAPRSNPAHSADPAVPAVLDDVRAQEGSLSTRLQLTSPAPAQEPTGDERIAGCRWPCHPTIAVAQLL